MASKSFNWQIVGIGGNVMVSLSMWWTTIPVTNANFVKQGGYFLDPQRPKQQLLLDSLGNGYTGEPLCLWGKMKTGHDTQNWWCMQHPFYYPFVLCWKQLTAVMTMNHMFHIPSFHNINLMLNETDTPREKLCESNFKFNCKISYHTLRLPIQPLSIWWSSSGYRPNIKMIIQSSAEASYLLAVTSLFNLFLTCIGMVKIKSASKFKSYMESLRKR